MAEKNKKMTFELPESLHKKAKQKALNMDISIKIYLNRLILADVYVDDVKKDLLTS
jgi:predicted HicB family RNase H-like nuclease